MLLLCKTRMLPLRLTARAVIGDRCFSKDDASSSDDEKDSKQPKLKKTPEKLNVEKHTEIQKEPATARLNKLLASMKTESSLTLNNQISMARPGEAHKQRKEAAKKEAASGDVVEAAKRVAALLGEKNKKQTESELLAKLLGSSVTEEAAAPTDKETKPKQQDSELSLSELIVAMKIDRRQQPPATSRSDYVRRSLTKRSQPWQKRSEDSSEQRPQPKRDAETYTGSVNLFGGEPLGVFKNVETLVESPDMLQTWAHLQRRELKLLVTHPPSNYFEKILQWTEQGKVWRFPIDNEQDWPDEVNVHFSEHIFLDQHLESWCPDKGPIRHFMELVCVGLSKNPYITAQDKKEHILWYRDYFEAKKDLLKDLMNQPKVQVSAPQPIDDH